MIEFSCLCGVKFSLGDEMAGEMFQCKACSRLVTVPTLDDLQYLKADGTYDIDESAQASKRVDHAPVKSGEHIAPVAAGDQSIPYDLEDAVMPAPRYDPFTGELIRAHEIVVTPDTEEAKKKPRTQPITKMKNRGAVTAAPRFPALQVLGEMFMAHNMSVLILMSLLHAGMAFFTYFTIEEGFFFFFYIPVLMMFVFLGYYAIIVQETGPGDKDDLPTPLRSFEFRADLWEPFMFMFLSIIACFAPAAVVEYNLGDHPISYWIGNAMLLLGMFVMPAVFLTAATSGVIANFRPDRVLGVIVKSGLNYLAVVAAWLAGIGMIFDGWVGLYVAGFHVFGKPFTKAWYVCNVGPSFVLLFGGLYFSYYACWLLGLIWRKHYQEYPWIAQRFEKEPFALPPSAKPAAARGAADAHAGESPGNEFPGL